MYKRRARIALLVGLVVLVSLSLPVAAPEAAPPAPPEVAKDQAVGECDGVLLASAIAPFATIAPFPGCIGSQPLSCANMPMPVGSTCSCTSQILDVKCKSCDPVFKGNVLETTCTVHTPCTNPPCDLQLNHSRTGYSCTR